MTVTPLYSWIHLSDIHFGQGDITTGIDQADVLQKLLQDITEFLPRTNITVQSVLVTGDIAFSGATKSRNEYKSAAIWLSSVAKAVKVTKKTIFVVPGNHDIQRRFAEVDPAVKNWLEELRADTRKLDNSLIDTLTKARLKKRFQNYLKFASQFGQNERPGAVLIDSWIFQAGLCWTRKINLRPHGRVIRLVGLNSALLCQDDHDEKQISIGKTQLVQGLSDIDKRKEIVIVLTHHPLNWMRDSQELERKINANADLHLCGHIHAAELWKFQSAVGGGVARIVAGAAHGDAHASLATRHGYNIASIVANEAGQLILRVWPRIWSPHRDHFDIDKDNTLRDENYTEFFLDHSRPLDIREPGKRHVIDRELLNNQESSPSSRFIPTSIPPLSRFFTGRTDVLGNLKGTLATTGSACLHGMFGIGKTSVALSYAYQNSNNYDQIIFVRSTEQEFLQQMSSIAETLDKASVEQLKDVKEKAYHLRSFLSDEDRWSRRKRSWLLILDNVENVETIKSFIPSNQNSHVLFTANSRDIVSLATEVEIDELGLEDGKLLLFRRSTNNPNSEIQNIPKDQDPVLDEIVLELGRSPLAINIAGAYLFGNRVTPSKYLTLIQSNLNSNIILDEEDKSDHYHNRTIWKAFEVSYLATCTADRPDVESALIASSAGHLLHASVITSPDAVPEEFLQAYLAQQGETYAEVANEERLWLKVREKATRLDLLRFDAHQKMFWTHRIIQKAIWSLIG